MWGKYSETDTAQGSLTPQQPTAISWEDMTSIARAPESSILKRSWASVFACKVGLVLKTGLHLNKRKQNKKHPVAQGKHTYRTNNMGLASLQPLCHFL